MVEFCSTDHWDNVCAFTFNMKQAVIFENGRWQSFDKITCEKCFKEFMRDLNRRIYKFAYTKHKKGLRVIAFIEKSKDRRYHFHAAIEAPKHMTQEAFCKFAMDVWLQQYFGYGHGDAKTNADRGWIDYMAKFRSKDGFDHYFDCLNIDAFNNKIVIA